MTAPTTDSEDDVWDFPFQIGDRVEVHWPKEKKWFVGDIADICEEDEEFLFDYNDEEWWHPRDMDVRKYRQRR